MGVVEVKRCNLNRQTDRQRQTETEIDRQRQTETEIDRQRQTDRDRQTDRHHLVSALMYVVGWLVTYDLLLETSKVYSSFLNDGVLLLNVWFSQLQVRMVNALSGTSKRVCLTTIHVLFSSSHTQFLLYVSLIAQLCIYISKCPCPCYWPCGFCGKTYKISCKSQICV